MVDSADFSKRLQKIMDRNDLNASSFAERIHVTRSSISHILSGRNKPSLDFVINTVKEFPEVDLYWLLNGKGTYPKTEVTTTGPTHANSVPSPIIKTHVNPVSTAINENEKPVSNDLFSTVENDVETTLKNINKGKNIQKVILLYDDGSFEYFIP
ncbi:MAG: helix-turn-helix transcriptional regulator [Nonlabens sp.]|uniref:helix-turn-helix domain-containing protein n=1 Tax=Nonlabens sp. TaxID=1888209 RepID=UPI00321ACB65